MKQVKTASASCISLSRLCLLLGMGTTVALFVWFDVHSNFPHLVTTFAWTSYNTSSYVTCQACRPPTPSLQNSAIDALTPRIDLLTPRVDVPTPHVDAQTHRFDALAHRVQGQCGLLKAARNLYNSSGVITPNCSASNFIVFECSKWCGGLGDREKGIISLFLLALVTNRTFVILHKRPCPLSTSLVPNLYDWTMCQEYIKGISVNDTGFGPGKTKINASTDLASLFTKRLVYIQSGLYSWLDRVVKNKRTKYQLPHLESSRCNVMSEVLNILFKPSRNMTTDINELFARKKQGRKLVCTHIRIGKNPSNPRDNHLPHGQPNVSLHFQFLDKYSGSRDHVIYIATDSDEVRNSAVRRYDNVFHTNRSIVHVDRFNGHSAEAACIGLYTAVMEQQLLSRCDVLLLSRSGFGAMAAYLRGRSSDLYCNLKNKIDPCTIGEIRKLYGFR